MFSFKYLSNPDYIKTMFVLHLVCSPSCLQFSLSNSIGSPSSHFCYKWLSFFRKLQELFRNQVPVQEIDDKLQYVCTSIKCRISHTSRKLEKALVSRYIQPRTLQAVCHVALYATAAGLRSPLKLVQKADINHILPTPFYCPRIEKGCWKTLPTPSFNLIKLFKPKRSISGVGKNFNTQN